MNSMISIVRGILALSKPETSESPRDESKGDLTILSVAWNQDCTGFIVGTSRGFNVYSCNPTIKRSISRALHESGFKLAEMLFLSNLFALVGNGYENSKYSPNKVFVWDDQRHCYVCELTFKSEVIAVKLTRKHVVVVLKQHIYVYRLDNLKVDCLIETVMNPKALCCVSHVETKTLLAYPGLHPGYVQVHDLKQNVIKLIKAHDSAIACMTLTLDGSLLATASTKGTLIRIFNPLDGTLLQELRRGIERAEIYNVAISSNLKWVAASSEKGTLHVFRLRPHDILSVNTPASSSSFMRGILPKYMYDNERSFAQFTLPASTKFIIGLGSENTVFLVGMDGSFRRCRFDQEDGGQMVELEHKCFFFSLQETDTMVVV